jgi:hypothetical protein
MLTSQKADAPSHLILPDVLSALHLSNQLSLWPLYREATVLLSLVMLNMEGAGLAEKIRTQLSKIQDQVCGGHWCAPSKLMSQVLASENEELIVMMDTALGEAEIEIALDQKENDYGMMSSFFPSRHILT